ncbi:hypothetical protein [Longispora albida]|uniref:hypothetical protein n=1 Tax=Longispora albida TaxID=203523 RepID=UPI000A0520B0|nr:hypothetical protein [Longispora albida]
MKPPALSPPVPRPKPGDVLRLTRASSPQFAKGLLLRVTKLSDRRSSVSGWAWVEGYQLNSAGDAVLKREVFINLASLP